MIIFFKGNSWHFSGTFNSLGPRQNGHHFPDDTFKCILLYENVRIAIEISLKFVSKGPINNCPSLVQMMAWRRPGDKPLSEPMMVKLLTNICFTRPQWVNHWGLVTPYEDIDLGHGLWLDLTVPSHYLDHCWRSINEVLWQSLEANFTGNAQVFCPWSVPRRRYHTLRPRQNGHHFQTTFSNAFSWMKLYEFRLKFHWSLFLGSN